MGSLTSFWGPKYRIPPPPPLVVYGHSNTSMPTAYHLLGRGGRGGGGDRGMRSETDLVQVDHERAERPLSRDTEALVASPEAEAEAWL